MVCRCAAAASTVLMTFERVAGSGRADDARFLPKRTEGGHACSNNNNIGFDDNTEGDEGDIPGVVRSDEEGKASDSDDGSDECAVSWFSTRRQMCLYMFPYMLLRHRTAARARLVAFAMLSFMVRIRGRSVSQRSQTAFTAIDRTCQ